MFKVVMKYSDGSTGEDEDWVVETEAEARALGEDLVAAHGEGGDVLHMSNPGDYPAPRDDEEPDFEVVEIDG